MKLYAGRLPACDIVCYWFEQARTLIEDGTVKRVGLLATNSIRGGANRVALERIKQTGDIFWAQSTRDWILEGAAVDVSMVGFDDGQEANIELDGHEVNTISSALTSNIDLTIAQPLRENGGLAFQGPGKAGPFDIDYETAKILNARAQPGLRLPMGPHRPG